MPRRLATTALTTNSPGNALANRDDGPTPFDASSIFTGTQYSEYSGNLTASNRSTGYYADKLLDSSFFDGAINRPRVVNNVPLPDDGAQFRVGIRTSTSFFGKDDKVYFHDPETGGVFEGTFLREGRNIRFNTNQDKFLGYFGDAGLESVRGFQLHKRKTGFPTRRTFTRQQTQTALTRRGGRR